MDVIIGDVPTVAGLAADIVEAALRARANPVLGLATGSTPLAVYDELVRRHTEDGLSFAHARAFTLDEYVGLPHGHPQRYSTVIESELTSRIDLRTDSVRSPDDSAENLQEACAAFEAEMAAAGGVDVQILGIGTDGHVAFNEPGSSFSSRTRLATLTRQTRADNARFFGDDVDAVPVHCLTQGLGTIMEARHVVLLAFGEAKSEAIAHLVEGSVSARWPATVLQHHPHVTVLVDEAAASRLELTEHYRASWALRPQGLAL